MLRVLSQRRYRDFHDSVIENSKLAWREVDRFAPQLYQDFYESFQKLEMHSSEGVRNDRNIEAEFRKLIAQEKYTKLRNIFFENLSFSYFRTPPLVPPYTGALPEPMEPSNPYRTRQVISGNLSRLQMGDFI